MITSATERTTLFAALNVLEGTVIAECQPPHRHQEFLRFLERIDAAVEPRLDIHLVLDNYGTHKHPDVKPWLKQRPRYHVHFTPTSSSWLNQIEHWFAEITRKRIRRGTFRSVRELIRAIKDYVRIYTKNPQPFQCVATANQIAWKVNKYKETLEKGD
jgi:transposase